MVSLRTPPQCNASPARQAQAPLVARPSLTVVVEVLGEGGQLPSPTEFLCLVHQGLLHGLVATQDHDPLQSQKDGEHRPVFLAHLPRKTSSALEPPPCPSSEPLAAREKPFVKEMEGLQSPTSPDC